MYDVNTKEWAKVWRVSVRTVQNWLKATHPVTDMHQMASIIIAKGLGGKDCQAKAHQVMLERDKRLPKGEESTDAAKRDSGSLNSSLGEGKKRVGAGFEGYQDEVVDLEGGCKYLWGRMNEYEQADNLSMAAHYHGLWLKTDKARRDAELHAQKLGVDEGSIINREEFARLVLAFAFWSVRGIELDLKHLADLVVDLPNKDVAYGVLDRYFLRKRFLSVFEAATKCDAGVALPKWCLVEMRRAVDVFFEVDEHDPDDVSAYRAFEAALADRSGGENA